jgi:DNA-binding winged helix-turn-helix (wHTH) protein
MISSSANFASETDLVTEAALDRAHSSSVGRGEMMDQNPQTAQIPSDPELAKSSEPQSLRYGPIEVDLQHETATRDGSRIKLSRKSFYILLALLEKAGQIVTRESLCQRLWPSDAKVDKQSNLNTTMNELRRSLGDSSQSSLYIKTIPRKGYVLTANPKTPDHPDPSARSHLNTGISSWNASLIRKFNEAAKSTLPLIIYILALILLGSLFGAGIMAGWIVYRGY